MVQKSRETFSLISRSGTNDYSDLGNASTGHNSQHVVKFHALFGLPIFWFTPKSILITFRVL